MISVINFGGSILSPSKEKIFDFERARLVINFLVEHTDKTQQFILCVGGGAITRQYQELLKENKISSTSQHAVGVAAINLNAVCLKSVAGQEAEDNIIRYDDYNNSLEKVAFTKKFLIAAANESETPRSSDWNSAYLAKGFNTNQVIALSNIDGVYTADPALDPTAQRINKLNWKEYGNIIGNPDHHEPGAKYPVDPIAASFCEENKISFIIANGNDLENLKNIIEGRGFVGTTIG